MERERERKEKEDKMGGQGRRYFSIESWMRRGLLQ